MLHRILLRVIDWAKAHHLYSLEFEERGMTLWVFVRAWEKDACRRVALAVSDRFPSGATHELSVLGSVVAAEGGSASLVAVSGGSNVMADAHGEYLGSGYNHKLVEYPKIDFCFLKRCLQRMASSVFASTDPISIDEAIFCHALEGGRALRRDDVTFQSS